MIHKLDMLGLACPLPVLKTHKRLKDFTPGSDVAVLCDDPSAEKDFREYCQVTGHTFISCKQINGVMTINLRCKD